MSIFDKKFRYHPSTDHNDPMYLRKRFEEIAGPGWNKKPRPKRAPKPKPTAIVTPLKVVK